MISIRRMSPLLLAGALSAMAQSPTGTISGVVTDTSGAALPGADVTVTEVSTNVSHKLKTDDQGRYTLPFTLPGTYKVTVNAANFQPQEQTGLHVQVAQTSIADFHMAVGQASAAVEVTADVQTLDTETSNLSDTIPQRFVLDLPDNGRNPFDFANLAPTVNNLGGASTPHIGGSRNGNNEQLIDGMTNILPENNVGNNESAYTPVVDSVQEVNVQTSVLEAQYGRFSGGIISLVTKGGSNQFHGTGFEFLNTQALNANSFAAPSGSVKAASHRYQTGGTFSGPLRREKTFFFVDFEDQRQAAATSITSSIPQNLPAFLTGDFSSLLTGNPKTSVQLYNPFTVHPDGSGNYVRDPFPNNQIPTALLNPIAQKVLTYYPKPQVTGTDFSDFTETGTNSDNYYHFDTRVDQQWTKKWHSFVRFSHFAGDNTYLQDYGNDSPASPGGYNGPSTGTAYSLSFDNTVTFTPTLTGEFRYGFSKATSVRTAFSQGFDPTTLGFGADIKGQAQQNALVFPHFSFSNGYSDIGTLGYVPLQENPLAHDVNGSLIKILGNHSVQVGGEFRYLSLNFYQYTYPAGTYSSDNSWTQYNPQSANSADPNNPASLSGGNPFASFLLGLPSSGDITNDPHTIQNSQYIAAYLQDTWKITRQLTLNYGLRWDTEIPRTEENNQLSYWNSTAASPLGAVTPAPGVSCPACGALKGSMVVVNTPASQYGRRQGPVQWEDFGPRFGFAYSPTSKVVVRGGFGLVFQPGAMQAAGTSGSPGIEGFNAQTNFSPSFNNQDSAPVTTLSNPYPSGYQTPPALNSTCRANPTCLANIDLGNGISQSFFTSYRNPYTEQYNLAVQFQLPFEIKTEVAYLGNHGLFLIDGDPGVPEDQLPTSYASLGSALLKQVPNPFYGVITTAGSPLSQPTIAANQLLRKWPQYNGVSAYRKPGASSNYNAFTLRVDRQFGRGINFTNSFTGSKAMDNSASSVTYLGPAGATYANQYNPLSEYSLSPFDVSRSYVASLVWELPFGQGQLIGGHMRKLEDLFAGGWQLNSIFSYSDGPPFLVPEVENGTTEAALLTFAQRPSLIGNPVGPNHTLNTAAFAYPAPYTIGNAPRVISGVRNPSSNDLDASLIKNTRFGDGNRFNAQFRLEAFNSLNHENLGSLNISTGGANPLTSHPITSFNNSPRVVQLGFKFYF
ncbi:MAG TPA: TonB-dependent receptor [Acidobacteriaceae bacterium]|nr:TonB-dependent receptor [Acidobacteriaceae bacterium]